MATYVALGVSLAKGEGYSEHYRSGLPDFFKNPREFRPKQPPTPTAKKAIGYPLFLAAVFSIFGYHLATVLYLQAILSALTTLLIYAVGRQVGSPKTAMTAYAISVFYCCFWFDAIMLLVEALLIFLTLLFVYFLIRWFMKPSFSRGFWTGLVGGSAFLVRPVVLPFIILCLLWGYVRYWQQKETKIFTISAIGLIVGLVLILAPWTIRNYRHSKRILLTPTFGGYQFLLVYNPYNLNFASYGIPGFLNESYPGCQSFKSSLEVNLPDFT
jgi:4-amino-4-deoxy-L-arabinose transferase-like glycosyltransferase